MPVFRQRNQPEASVPDARVVTIEAIAVNLVDNQWWAMATVGGIPIRGRAAPDPVRALQQLLWEFTGSSGNDNAQMALAIAAKGTTLDNQLARLIMDGQIPAGAMDALPEAPGSRSAGLAEGYRQHGHDRGQAGDTRAPGPRDGDPR